MQTNRRNWLKQIGLVSAGLSIAPFKTFALPETNLLTPAPTGDSPIRLSANESPYGPSPLARVAMAESINNSNRYNWNTTGDLISALAEKNNVSTDNILIGAGSTEILDSVVRYVAAQKGNFVVANPSYTNWTKAAEKQGLKKTAVPLTKDKKHDLPAMLAAIDTDTRLVYICNPNNPTGTVCEREALLSFITEATKKTIVMVDEAYIDFTDQLSVSVLVTENTNLVVIKTFSKIYGLAGARIGYAMAHPNLINKMNELQSWANGGVSLVSRAGAIASLNDSDFIKQCYTKNEAARKYTIEHMTALGISCIPSHTNFIYFSLANYKKNYSALLKSNNIQGTHIYEEDGKWTRITVGTMDEMKKLIAALQ